MTNEDLTTPVNTGSKFNLKKAISLYTKQWKWFVLSIFLLLALVFLRLRYTIPQYRASSEIMLINDNEDTPTDKIFEELSLSKDKDNDLIEDEILVFKSRNVIKSVVKELGLNVQYFTQGLVLETEIYYNPPVNISFVASDSIIEQQSFNFYIDVLSNETFNYRELEDQEPKTVAFGENIDTAIGGIVVTPRQPDVNSLSSSSFRVQLSRVNDVVEDLRDQLIIYPSQNSSRILSINLEDPIIDKARDIINTLVKKYDAYSVGIKNRKSEGTVLLIDERINRIASDLINVDDSIVRFKINNKVTDVNTQADQFVSSSFANEQQMQSINTQLRLLNYTKERLNSNSGAYQSIPTNLGDASISALCAQYNQLIVQRQNYLKSAGQNNPVVLELDQTIRNVRTNLKQNIEATLRSLNIQLNSLQNQYQSFSSKISSVPAQENRLRSIERKQGIKESIYLYLLEKKEEAIISQTVTSSNVKIIDSAYSLGRVSPNGKILYIGALFLGFVIPFGFIYAKDLLDTKIHNKEDLDAIITDTPIIGEVPRLSGSDKLLITKNDRSILSESFRIIRTNFDFVRRARHVDQYNNVVFVTSTINGEGKSFFSMNMALTMASTGKKVLIIGGDIRNPKVFSDVKNPKTTSENTAKGLTEYLIDDTVSVKETIQNYTVNEIKLDVVLSGSIPPNPADVLMNEDRFKALFDTVSQDYDYVIVDTAPSMLVTDTLLISKYAGHTIYITRAGYTEKEILSFVKELKANKKLNGVILAVNDVDQSNYGYGAKYGYYGAPKKKKWFSKS